MTNKDIVQGMYDSFATGDVAGVTAAFADDISWTDYGCYGNSAARTPRIDRLAAAGIRFDAAFLTATANSFGAFTDRAAIVAGSTTRSGAAARNQPATRSSSMATTRRPRSSHALCASR